ncbi:MULTISPECIES: hypothetical protein [Nitrincola]|uniref:Uncharacterized protein n=1 Tax=Nitrincola nitratireducens TaxID=1229521 RepID=W9VJJ6_9GAMM|nr:MULTISPECIES: hypothetical protein [Nitrincola]EXJ10745.1 hypothetical protein D791_02350 [Nitrincola nitratireducens]
MANITQEAYETLGLYPSITLIVGGFLVAILPLIVQISVLLT